MRKSYEFYKIFKNAHFVTKFVRRTRFVHNFKILTDFAMRFFYLNDKIANFILKFFSKFFPII